MDLKELKINLKDEKIKNESINSKFLNLKEEKQQLNKEIYVLENGDAYVAATKAARDQVRWEKNNIASSEHKGRFRGVQVAVKKLHSLVSAFGEVDTAAIDEYLRELDVTAGAFVRGLGRMGARRQRQREANTAGMWTPAQV